MGDFSKWVRSCKVALVSCAVLAVAGCGDPETVEPGQPDPAPSAAVAAPVEGQPVSIGLAGLRAAAAFGESVAVINSEWGLGDSKSTEVVAAAAMQPDGEWTVLPSPKPVSGRRMTSLNGTLLLMGEAGGELTLQQLRPGESGWTDLDLPSGLKYVPDETGYSAVGSGNRNAIFGIDAGMIVVDERGSTQLVPPDPKRSSDGTSTLCVQGDLLLDLRMRIYRTPVPGESSEVINGGLGEEVPEELVALDLTRMQDGWTRRSTPPAPPDGFGGAADVPATCGPSGPVFIQGQRSALYSVADDRWRVSETGPAIDRSTMFRWSGNATARDSSGSQLIVDEVRRVLLSLSPAGAWSQLDLFADAVVSTPSASYAIHGASNSIVPVSGVKP